MTLHEFASSIVGDARYRETVRTRAFAGTLPPDVESMLLELADQHAPVAPARPPQSRTLALVRPAEAQP